MENIYTIIIFLIIGGAIAYAGFLLFRKRRKMELSGTKTRARVVDFKKEVDDDGTLYYPVIRFTASNGDIITQKLDFGYSWKSKKKEYSIIYLIEDGAYEVMVNSEFQKTTLPYLLICFGLFFVVFALALLYIKIIH